MCLSITTEKRLRLATKLWWSGWPLELAWRVACKAFPELEQ